MKVYEVIGYAKQYEEEDWHYAICATKDLAEREKKNAIQETTNDDYDNDSYNWVIEECDLITE